MGVNLTDLYIDESFQKLVQTSGSIFTDGTGSVITSVNITASHAVSASYAVSASVEIIKEVSSSHADIADFADAVSGSTVIGSVPTADLATTASYVEYTNVANKPTLLSGSAQIASDISGSFTSTSASIATDIAGLVVDSGSFSTRITDLEAFSSSLDDNFVTEAELVAATASLSASLAVDIAKNAATGSNQESRLDTLESKTLVSGSSQIILQDTTGDLSGSRINGPVQDSVNSVSASHAVQADSSLSSISASYAVTASYVTNIPPTISSSYATSASHAEQADNATNATNADYIAITQDSVNANRYVTFVGNTSGDEPLKLDVDLKYNPVTNNLQATNVTAEQFFGTGSGIIGVISASHAVQSDTSISSSYSATSISASHALNADTSISSSHSVNSDLAITASYAKSVDAAGVTGSVEFAEFANNTIVYGKNLSGGIIAKGTPLYFTGSGTSGNVVGVYPADAGNPARMPAGGIAGEQLAIGGEGKVFLDGFLNGVDTSAFNSGDSVYVAVGGGYTNVKPTGSANLIQALGYVEKSDLNGSGVIQGSGRANDLPNIPEGQVWVGNSNDVPAAVNTSSLDVATAVSSSHALNADTAITANTATNASFASAAATASYVEYSNVANKPTLISSSAQIASDISGSFTQASASFSTRITSQEAFSSSLDDTYATDAELNAATASLSASLAVDIATNTSNISTNTTNISTLTSKTGSYATTGSNTFIGNQTVTGSLKVSGSGHTINGDVVQQGYIQSNFTAPGTNQEKAFFNINGSQVAGKNFNRVFYGQADYPAFGNTFNDYFAIEYYDGFGYNFGSEFDINGATVQLIHVTSASLHGAATNRIALLDNFAGTTKLDLLGDYVEIDSRTDIRLSGDSIIVTGSVIQQVGSLTISSNTASLNMGTGDYFNLTLVSGSDTHLDATNISAGQTVTVKVTQPSSAASTLSFSPDFKFPNGVPPTITNITSSVDILTFITYDNTNVYGTVVQNLS